MVGIARLKPGRFRRRHFTVACVLAFSLVVGGCRRTSDQPSTSRRVVVYCSVDEQFARPVLDRFQQARGVAVQALFDSEAGKTIGLVNRIRSEALSGGARADVFWSGEVFQTVLLGREVFLEPYSSPAAVEIPNEFKDKDFRWTGYALRARVLAYDPARVREAELPQQWEELARPEIASSLAIANPLFGTTRGHVAAMFALWGKERGRVLLEGLKKGGALVVDGNSSAVRAVLDGRAKFAATDSDDVYAARKSGAKLEMAPLDLGDGGTLMIPCTAALVKGGPHPDEGRALIDYLLSAEVETALAQSDSGNIPVRQAVRDSSGRKMFPASRISYDAVADAMEDSVQAVREILLR